MGGVEMDAEQPAPSLGVVEEVLDPNNDVSGPDGAPAHFEDIGQDVEEYPETASLYYLDAFAGRGKYQEDVKQCLGDDMAIFGSPIIAVEKAISALSTLTGSEFERYFQAHRFVVDFIFNDKYEENLAVLKTLVLERFELHEWVVESRETLGVEENVIYIGKWMVGYAYMQGLGI